MSEFKDYVVGFYFDPEVYEVCLIRKNRPDWQKGRLNGVGGKIEDFDLSPQAAMAREFEEEAGLGTYPVDWELFAILHAPDNGPRVFCYVMQSCCPVDWDELEAQTDEQLVKADSWHLPHDALPNLEFLVPLARNFLFSTDPMEPVDFVWKKPWAVQTDVSD